MKKPLFFTLALLVLVALVLGLLRFSARGAHRARFIIAMHELRDADAALQKHGGFTNQVRSDAVYAYTNLFEVNGTVYQCKFAVGSVDLYLRNRGILAITTNDLFVWIDKERGVMPLGKTPGSAFPPGF